MKDRFLKANGFPTSYGYACGHGRAQWNVAQTCRKTIFEDANHNCIDVRWDLGWEQFFYADGPGAARRAERLYNSINLEDAP